jgi:predicted site-specific integrase-resolvase
MKLYTLQEAAKYLSVSLRTVDRLIRSGELPHVNVSPSLTSKKPRRRIQECDLLTFVASRRKDPRAERKRRRRRVHVR